jgi:hypothetical protein
MIILMTDATHNLKSRRQQMKNSPSGETIPVAAQKREVRAVVFLIAHPTGDYEVMSVDRKVYASGSSLDQAFWRYYKKGMRIMKKQGTYDRAHPPEPEAIASEDDVVPEAVAVEDAPVVDVPVYNH